MEIFGNIWKYLEVSKMGIKLIIINIETYNNVINIIILINYLHDNIFMPIWKQIFGGKGHNQMLLCCKFYFNL